MNNDVEIRTATMARIYAKQGYFHKASEIYRFLLTQEPENPEFIAAQAEIQQRTKFASLKGMQDMVGLVQEWVDLLWSYHKLQKLKKIFEGYRSGGRNGEPNPRPPEDYGIGE